MTARPFFLPVASRRVFALHHPPSGAPQGAILYLPPFAEEMNKSRRMAALQARALANSGWHVLQIDYHGTGDSDGDHADARWSTWLDDVDAARTWLAAESGVEPWIWGLRLGALLAGASITARPAPGLLLWQPVTSGLQHLQQFLRLKAGAEWLAPDKAAQVHARPLDMLKAGETVEVAGYRLHPELAVPMAEVSLQVTAAWPRVLWFEVAPRPGATLSPAGERVVGAQGLKVQATAIQGPSFWQSQEIEIAPALLEATTRALTP